MRSVRACVLAVLAAAALFGTAGTAQALGPDDTSPLGVGTVRLLIGGAALFAALPWFGHGRREVLGLLRRPEVLVAAGGTAAYQFCFFAGVDRAGVALGTLVTVGSAPVAAGLLGVLAGHRLTVAWGAATAICLTGLVLLSAEGLDGGDPWGVVLALAAGAAISAYTVAVKRILDRGASAAPVMAASFLLAGALLLPVLPTQPIAWLVSPGGVALAVYLGLATMTLANTLYGMGLRGLAPGPATTLVLAEPVVATVLGVVVLDEVLRGPAVAGVLLVLAGLVLQGLSLARGRDPRPDRALSRT
jgi:DME family drug/metabolite transporter